MLTQYLDSKQQVSIMILTQMTTNSTPFEPLPPVEPVTHTPLEANEVVITPAIERLAQAYDTLYYPPTAQIVIQKCITHRHTTTGREFNITARINTRQSDKTAK